MVSKVGFGELEFLKYNRNNVFIRAKPDAEPGVRKLLTNYQTGFLRTADAQSDSSG